MVGIDDDEGQHIVDLHKRLGDYRIVVSAHATHILRARESTTSSVGFESGKLDDRIRGKNLNENRITANLVHAPTNSIATWEDGGRT